eukprot:CAMPEP_0194750786 /NCGR_PEP_ID=MMETSP0323_2-20130528/4888_1 /TAXON_ID=2866 ORGANISM="Crypthecodinium cohnii, Strain Seligo" /NCGR_SAMPLE_ID=MMETSP0323_2 /ASSEMBLY_ACC=CAM_ASM_000346 /LENGTH=91 /DNA_ID=CAMNT_0039666841 /DNA_START=9 /DNA_END=284 /DNA_ORIENTATION=-
MARIGTCNLREKDKHIHVQDETWRSTVHVERIVEEIPHKHNPKNTYHDQAMATGPTVSTSHSSFAGGDVRAAQAEKPAGKPSMVGMTWGVQ